MTTDEVGGMSLNCMSFNLHRYDAIVSGWYLKSLFHNSTICLLFTVYSVGKESTFLLNVAVPFSSLKHRMVLISSVHQCQIVFQYLDSLSHRMKLCENLKSVF